VRSGVVCCYQKKTRLFTSLALVGLAITVGYIETEEPNEENKEEKYKKQKKGKTKQKES
jgi:hypothetical protein